MGITLTMSYSTLTVGTGGAIRDGHRVRVVVASQHACVTDDDDVYAKRAGTELSQGDLVREDQQLNRAQGPEPRDQPVKGERRRDHWL